MFLEVSQAIKERRSIRSFKEKEVSKEDSLDFLEVHNIQSFEGADLRLGLYYNNHLVSCMGLTNNYIIIDE